MERGKGGKGPPIPRLLFAETHRTLEFFTIPIQSLYRPPDLGILSSAPVSTACAAGLVLHERMHNEILLIRISRADLPLRVRFL